MASVKNDNVVVAQATGLDVINGITWYPEFFGKGSSNSAKSQTVQPITGDEKGDARKTLEGHSTSNGQGQPRKVSPRSGG